MSDYESEESAVRRFGPAALFARRRLFVVTFVLSSRDPDIKRSDRACLHAAHAQTRAIPDFRLAGAESAVP